MVEAVSASKAVAPMETASMDEAFTDEDSTDQASLDSGLMTATGTVMDIQTGTESLPVMIHALSFASV